METKRKSILEKIATFLSKEDKQEETTELNEVSLESQTLKDGTVVTYESWEAGASIFIQTEDEEQVPLPAGRYELEDGQILVISEDGIIGSVEEAPTEEEEEMKEEVKELSLEEALARIEELEAENGELKTVLEEAQAELSKEVEEETEETEETTELSAEEKETEDVTSQRQEVKQTKLSKAPRGMSRKERIAYMINGKK